MNIVAWFSFLHVFRYLWHYSSSFGTWRSFGDQDHWSSSGCVFLYTTNLLILYNYLYHTNFYVLTMYWLQVISLAVLHPYLHCQLHQLFQVNQIQKVSINSTFYLEITSIAQMIILSIKPPSKMMIGSINWLMDKTIW